MPKRDDDDKMSVTAEQMQEMFQQFLKTQGLVTATPIKEEEHPEPEEDPKKYPYHGFVTDSKKPRKVRSFAYMGTHFVLVKLPEDRVRVYILDPETFTLDDCGVVTPDEFGRGYKAIRMQWKANKEAKRYIKSK